MTQDARPQPEPEGEPATAGASVNLMNQQLGHIRGQLDQIEANARHTRDSQVIVLLVVAVGMGTCAAIIYQMARELPGAPA